MLRRIWPVTILPAGMVKAYKMLFVRRKPIAYLLLRESDKFDFIKDIDVTL
jgi:hypothetical protein